MLPDGGNGFYLCDSALRRRLHYLSSFHFFVRPIDAFFLSMGDSGHFVLARWTNDEDKTEIEMTAFKVRV